MVLVCVAVACRAALRGHDELLVLVQDHLLPLAVLGAAFAGRVGGRRLVREWLDTAPATTPLDEFTAPALVEALVRSGRAFLDRAVAVLAPDARVWTRVVHEAVARDARAVLELVHDRLPLVTAPLAMEIAAREGNVALLRWLRARSVGGPLTRKAFAPVLALGSLELVEACAPFGRKPLGAEDLWAATEHAARHGHVHVLAWLCDKYDVQWCLHHALVEALCHDQVETAEYLAHHKAVTGASTEPWSRPESGLITLCRTGDTTKLQWLQERGLLADRINAHHLETAKTHGQVGVLEFVEATLPAVFRLHIKPFGADNAKGGSVQVAQWALARGLLHKSIGCVYAAASEGQIEFVRWYVAEMENDETGMEYFPSYTTVPAAARNGHIECVQFLVEKGWGESSIQAVMAAAEHGHRDLFAWLVERCRQPISFAAVLQVAAAGGHLDVVQWLTRKPPLTPTHGFVTAAARGHWRVVQWLLDNRNPSKAYLDAAMFEAVRGGRLRVVRVLPWTRRCDHEALARLALSHNHVHVATWIQTFRSADHA